MTVLTPTLTLPDPTTRPAFRNEPFTAFKDPTQRQAFQAALDRVLASLGQTYPLVIGGQEIRTEKTFASLNPAAPETVVGHFSMADAALVDRALDAATTAFQTWRHVPAAERAAYLLAAADEMRRRKHEFSAWMVVEVGKSWAEADGDTAEAIDFLEYYAREMVRLERRSDLVPYPGEANEQWYIPLGVGAVIPPWNFPNAILTGMTSASIVAGNTVLLKPASTSPAIAWQVAKLFFDAGLPAGVLNFVPGSGSVMGDAVVDDKRTRYIAFTGSKEVGLRIHERAAKHQPGQLWIKRTILEMGGKDFVLVDETADLDAAAHGVVVSAFGFQGQKCSAGSRAIIVADVYDAMVEKIVQKAKEIVNIGDTTDPDVYMGPVVDKAAYKSILDYIEIGKGEGRLLLGGGPVEGQSGYFIQPTIIADVAPDAVIAQEEIFGPVLAILRAADFDEAVAIANGTEYGLTGALYTGRRERIERGKRELFVGNLYFNRKCTGALVGVHPFGGFNMSGTDSKAGGPDYLLLFTQPKALSEKL